jgi:hypothetical protein
VKQHIPWPIKFSLKMLLAPLDYKWLKRSGLVEHGKMEQAGFAREIFRFHVQQRSAELHVAPGGTLLELGPGDSVASGILGRGAGFSAVDLVDVAHIADLRPAALDSLLVSLGAERSGLPASATAGEVRAWLDRQGIHYLTQGLHSLRQIDTETISYSFSNTVLQHVHRDELPEIVRELGRVHAPGSFASHSVNFTDHFSGGFLNHRLPEWLMESAWVKRANLYTNRIAPAAFVELFEGAGLRVHATATDFYDAPPATAPVVLSSTERFRASLAARPILRVVYILHKPRASAGLSGAREVQS